MRIAVAGGTGRLGRHVVDVLTGQGHEAVPLSRATGVDVVTGDGLAEALTGAEVLIDAATGPSPVKDEAAAFFTASAANLQRAGKEAGVQRAVVVSIIGVDKLTTSYGAAKLEQEGAWLDGPLPVRILRADLFHEFVAPVMEWGRQGDVVYVQSSRRRPVAARAVAETLAAYATAADAPDLLEVAGPRVEDAADLAATLVARTGDPARVEAVSAAADDPDGLLYEAGRILPGPDAVIAGPAFADWLETADAQLSGTT